MFSQLAQKDKLELNGIALWFCRSPVSQSQNFDERNVARLNVQRTIVQTWNSKNFSSSAILEKSFWKAVFTKNVSPTQESSAEEQIRSRSCSQRHPTVHISKVESCSPCQPFCCKMHTSKVLSCIHSRCTRSTSRLGWTKFPRRGSASEFVWRKLQWSHLRVGGGFARSKSLSKAGGYSAQTDLRYGRSPVKLEMAYLSSKDSCSLGTLYWTSSLGRNTANRSCCRSLQRSAHKFCRTRIPFRKWCLEQRGPQELWATFHSTRPERLSKSVTTRCMDPMSAMWKRVVAVG